MRLNYSKRVTFEEMGHTCRNRPRLKKSRLDLLKWLRFEEMGHTRNNRVMFLKHGAHLRN